MTSIVDLSKLGPARCKDCGSDTGSPALALCEQCERVERLRDEGASETVRRLHRAGATAYLEGTPDPLGITHCPVCSAPAHANESDESYRHPGCAAIDLGIRWWRFDGKTPACDGPFFGWGTEDQAKALVADENDDGETENEHWAADAYTPALQHIETFDTMLYLAAHAPPTPEWFTPTMPYPRAVDFQDSKGHGEAINAYYSARLFEWPWVYARAVLEADPRGQRFFFIPKKTPDDGKAVPMEPKP